MSDGEERDVLEELERMVAVPPGPRCERCDHGLCPSCPLPWCDRVLGDRNTPVADRELCCDGECHVAWDDYLEWQLELEALGVLDYDAFQGWTVVAMGPWLPAAIRRARGVAGWYPAQPFLDAPRVAPLMARVALWQRECGLRHTDGLIGPMTWARRDEDLVQVARELATELEAADLGWTQTGRFLMTALRG